MGWVRPLSGAVVGKTEGKYSQCGRGPRPHPGLGSPLSTCPHLHPDFGLTLPTPATTLGSPLSTCPHLHPDRDPIAVCSSRIGSIASNTNDTRRPASQRYSRGTHVVHTGYSRGTHGVLTGYSRGTQGYSRVLTGHPGIGAGYAYVVSDCNSKHCNSKCCKTHRRGLKCTRGTATRGRRCDMQHSVCAPSTCP